MTPVCIYVPQPGQLKTIRRGAGIVGTVAETVTNAVVIDYEEPGPAVNVVTYADRVMIATSRHVPDREGGPRAMTHKRMLVGITTLIAVGTYDGVKVRLFPGASEIIGDWLSDGEALVEVESELALSNA